MGKKSLLVILVFLTSILFSSCSINNVTNSVSNTLIKESDAKLNTGIQSGNLERVKEAIEDGANINRIKVSLVSEENPVILAITKNQKKIAEYLINNGADVNYTDSSGRSLLMFSAYNTDISFCELLIKHGANVNQEDKNGYTALEYVFDHSRKATTKSEINQIITIFLEHGAQIRPITLKAALKEDFSGSESRYSLVKRVVEGLIKEGNRPELNNVLEAAITGDISRIGELIKENKMHEQDVQQQVLFYTAAFGNVETMKLLIDKEINYNSYDKLKNTPLIIASQYGNFEMVKYLLSKGVNIEERNKDSESALYVAVKYNHFEVSKYLIENGASIKPFSIFSGTKDVFSQASANGNTELMKLIISKGYTLDADKLWKAMSSAISESKLDSVKFLLNYGADINMESNESSLLENIYDLEIVKYMVEHGAKVDGINVKGKPLYNAVKLGNIDVVEYLIKNGANVNIVPKYKDGSGGESALMAAAYSGEFEIVKLLVENGADVNYQDENADKDMAIIWAARGGSIHILEYLIQKGAKVNYQNEKGETALMCAASQGQLDCVKVLMKYKAEASLKDKEGHTAFDKAKSGSNNDIIDLLESYK